MRAIENARQKNLSIPLAHVIDETLTIERAYRVQKQIVTRKLETQTPVGFKAGLTSAPAQQRFGSNESVAGVLMNAPLAPGSSIELRNFPGLHLEIEVAMRIAAPVHRKLESVVELRAHIDGIAPAIELPDLHYERPDQLNALDIIASNVAAAHFMIGNFSAPDLRDANLLHATLECSGQALNEGRGRDSMGDQWAAALWLVNTLIDQGWQLEPGQVLLTGALGKMVKATAGECAADFGDWGTLSVRIE